MRFEGQAAIVTGAARGIGEAIARRLASDVGVENDALQEGDAYVWYEVREVTPSALRPFEEVKDKDQGGKPH